MSLSRLFPYLAGPEIYWTCVCLAMHLLGARNSPPTEAGSRWLEQFWYWIPLVFVPLAFAALAVPGPGRWWLLLRIDLATLVGMAVAAYLVTNAVDYGDSRNSGTGAGFMIAIGFGVVVLVLGTLVAVAVLAWRGSSRS